MSEHLSPICRRILAGAALLTALLASAPALAQAVVATINSDPVTSFDLSEREKLLRVLHMPASPAAALDSLIKERLQAHELDKFGIKIKDSEIGPTVTRYAERAHIRPEVLEQQIKAAHVDEGNFKAMMVAEQGFLIYAHARNRGLEISEEEIRAELAKERQKKKPMQYVLRQIIIAVPSGAGVAGLEGAVKEMTALHARFTDCVSGAKIAEQTPNAIVREQITRSSAQLPDQLRELFDKTPEGHLTPPSRDQSGIAALAVCSKSAAKDDTAEREAISSRLLSARIEKDAEALYQELRARAVIVKHRS